MPNPLMTKNLTPMKMYAIGFLATAFCFSFGWYVRGSDNYADAKLRELYAMNDSLNRIAERMPRPVPTPLEDKLRCAKPTDSINIDVCTFLDFGNPPNYRSRSMYETLSSVDKDNISGEMNRVLGVLKYCQDHVPHVQ